MNDAAEPEQAPPSRTLPGETTRGGRERLGLFLGSDPGRGHAVPLLPYLGSAAVVAIALACGVVIERYIGVQSVLIEGGGRVLPAMVSPEYRQFGPNAGG